MGLARSFGSAVSPRLTKKLEKGYIRNRGKFEAAGRLVKGISDTADAYTSLDPFAGYDAAKRTAEAAKGFTKSLKKKKVSKKRKAMQEPGQVGLPGPDGGQQQPRISGDLMNRMTKLARVG